MPFNERFVAAGLLEVTADRLDERRQLIGFLLEQGCTVEEMVVANERGRLFGLAGDRMLRPGGSQFSLEETAAHLHLELPVLKRIWEALGFRVPESGQPAVSTDERAVLTTIPLLVSLIGETKVVDVCRSVAIGLGGVAEATSAVARSQPEMSTALSSELETARAWTRNAPFTPWMGHLLDVFFRQHLELARGRFEATDSYEVASTQQVGLAVGFVDVSGFTAATEAITPSELSDLVRRFEQASIDAVQPGGGRVVKFIGDAAMIVAPTADELAAAASSLIVAWDTDHGSSTGARAGLAFGTVTSRQGDYFGSAVNLAARLVALALRNSILVTESMAARLSIEDWIIGQGESLDVRGFSGTVTVHSLRPTSSPP